MHCRWQFEQECQQAAFHEEKLGTMRCLSCSSFKHSLRTQISSVLSRQQLRLCCVHLPAEKDAKFPLWHSFISALYSPEHFSAELLLLSFSSWQGGSQVYTMFSFPLHVSILVTAGAPCPNSACSAAVCWENLERRGGRRRQKDRTGLNIFQGSCHFLSDQPGAVGLQIKSVPKKKRRQQNTDSSFAFQPPPGKVPSSGKAGNFPWPTYSLSSVFISLWILSGGFIDEIPTAVFLAHGAACFCYGLV